MSVEFTTLIVLVSKDNYQPSFYAAKRYAKEAAMLCAVSFIVLEQILSSISPKLALHVLPFHPGRCQVHTHINIYKPIK